MSELAVVGDSEFIMGFQLIGIKKIFEGETRQELRECYTQALNDFNIGIIVTNNTAIQKLDPYFRRNVENSITPVVVVLSIDEFAQDNLRDMIKKAIGIDLLAR